MDKPTGWMLIGIPPHQLTATQRRQTGVLYVSWLLASCVSRASLLSLWLRVRQLPGTPLRQVPAVLLRCALELLLLITIPLLWWLYAPALLLLRKACDRATREC